MIIYNPNISPRLSYIADFTGRQLTGQPAILTSSKEEFMLTKGAKINFSSARIGADEIWLSPHSLLFEKGAQKQIVDCFEWNNHKAFFKTDGDFPFDIFAASFYLLSRYEEYLPHKKDIYGRYAHENSLAFNNDFLHLPLVNIWIENFKNILKEKYSAFNIQHSTFKFTPTYDIDEAYSFKFKSWWRTTGGYARSLINGNLKDISKRLKVRSGKASDPFDSYSWMDQLHENYTLNPLYFFLVAAKSGKYDKNISPSSQSMQTLVQNHAKRYEVGIHPSWQSGDDPEKLKLEILKLGQITSKQVLSSRQHFIWFTLPDTFRQLIDAGIKSDYSMGYGSINGFRASVASPFYWYDLEKEQTTNLLIHPFCYMEANSFFEQKLSPEQALEEMQYYRNVIRSINGTMITIWHNTFLGTGKLFEGWREVYEQFISEL